MLARIFLGMKKQPQFNFDTECNFSDLLRSEREAACKYEYMRESHTLRDKLEAARSAESAKDQKEGAHEKRVNAADRFFRGETEPWGRHFGLHVALLKTGFPKPWNQLTKAARKELAEVISRWDDERKESYPPVVIRAGIPERDYERGMASPMWRLTLSDRERHWPPKSPTDSFFAGQSERRYSYGFIRIDESYNATEAKSAFTNWFLERYGKTKGGGSTDWQAKLNDLVVMRLGNRFPRREDATKRVEHVAEYTTAGFKGCKDWWNRRCEARRKKEQVDRFDQPNCQRGNEQSTRACAGILSSSLSWRETVELLAAFGRPNLASTGKAVADKLGEFAFCDVAECQLHLSLKRQAKRR